MFCPNCGSENIAQARFCANCGTPLDSAQVPQPAAAPAAAPVQPAVAAAQPAAAPAPAYQQPAQPYEAAAQQPSYDSPAQPYAAPAQQPSYGNPAQPYAAATQQINVTVQQATYQVEGTNKTLRLVNFILCLLTTIATCWVIVPLLWCIPMTVHSWGIYKGTKPNTTVFGVCTLIFVSLIGGILLLVADKDE